MIKDFSKNIVKDFSRNLYIITENKNSTLKRIQEELNCSYYEHSKLIGGRYSIFSNVGMIPAVIAGLNVKEIHAGALEQINNTNSEDFIKIARFFKFQKGIKLKKFLMRFKGVI